MSAPTDDHGRRCTHCGTSINHKRADASYCSKSCANKARAQTAHSKALRREAAAARYATPEGRAEQLRHIHNYQAKLRAAKINTKGN